MEKQSDLVKRYVIYCNVLNFWENDITELELYMDSLISDGLQRHLKNRYKTEFNEENFPELFKIWLTSWKTFAPDFDNRPRVEVIRELRIKTLKQAILECEKQLYKQKNIFRKILSWFKK